MKAKIIKTLAKQSFVDNNLDTNSVKIIASHLKRKDLRTYLRALKVIDQQNTVLVGLAADDENTQKSLQIRFPDKKIVYTLNRDLLAGIRIVNNDLLYDFSLQDKIERLVSHFYDTND